MVTFDPYLNWLGIPPHEQPPNFYRLLGVVLFESNPKVIEQAADRQSLRVGGFQAGPQGGLCQRLLSEIAMARFCLLDPQQKAAYDGRLNENLARRGERTVAAPPAPPNPRRHPPRSPRGVISTLPSSKSLPRHRSLHPTGQGPGRFWTGHATGSLAGDFAQSLAAGANRPHARDDADGRADDPVLATAGNAVTAAGNTRSAGDAVAAAGNTHGADNAVTAAGNTGSAAADADAATDDVGGTPHPQPRPRPLPQAGTAADDVDGKGSAPAAPRPSAPAPIPVAAPYRTPTATAVAAGPSPWASTEAPPAAPQRPMDELERLSSQPSSRRPVPTKKKKNVVISKEIIIGSVVGAVGLLLVISYLAVISSQGNAKHGPRTSKPGTPAESERTKHADDPKQKEVERKAARAADNNVGPVRPMTPATTRRANQSQGADDGGDIKAKYDFGRPTRAMDAPDSGHADAAPPAQDHAQNNNQDHDTPMDLGTEKDPVFDQKPEK